MTVAGKPISHYRVRTRQAPPSPPRRLPVKPPLWEFVLLSMLLHATAIMLFGAPSGGSREGRAMWGAMQVVLQGAPHAAGPNLKIDRGLGVDRTKSARITPMPVPRAQTPAPPTEARPVEPTPKELPPIAVPPPLDRIVTPDRTPELAPFRLPPPTPGQPAPPPAPAPVVPAPVMQPVPLPVPLPERVFTPHAEIAPVASPVIPALPATPPVLRPPVEIPALPVPTLESVAPPRVEAASKPNETAPVAQTPLPAPTAPANLTQPTLQREGPARIERAPAPREEPALQSAPFRPSRPSIDSSVNAPGEPATKYDPTAPGLDLDAMRKRAGEMARAGAGNRALLPFAMPPLPPKKSKMETAIENARKPDCRTAYAQLGLAAVVPLIANEFGEGNCRW